MQEVVLVCDPDFGVQALQIGSSGFQGVIRAQRAK